MARLLFDSTYYQKWKELNKLEPGTEKRYRYGLKHFEDYLVMEEVTGELDFNQFYYSPIHDLYAPIDVEFMDGFIEYIGDGLTRSNAKHTFTAVRSFLNLLVDYDLIDYNPLRYFRNPFLYESFRNRALTEEESLHLLKAALEIDPFFQRAYLIVLLQTTCGLRAKELCKLTISQIDFEHGFIVIDKGQKTSIGSVSMTPALEQKLKSYMNHPYFLEWSRGEDKELFFLKNKPLTPVVVNKLLDQLRQKAHIKRKVTNHDLRATMAFLLYKEGNDVRAIQMQLRHKRLKTTLGYLPIHVDLKGYLES